MQEIRNASDQLTFQFLDIDSVKYSKITKSIVNEFDLVAVGPRTNGLDERFQDFKKGEFNLGLEWDIWSGYIVVARTESSELFVREIAVYIQNIHS